MQIVRYALVRNARDAEHVAAYLPANYRVSGEVVEQVEHFICTAHGNVSETRVVVIEGRDDAGWTLDGYVLPRLASGNIWGEEIDLSHPVMKSVPA